LEGLKVDGGGTKRIRKVNSLTRYSIASRLRAVLESALSQPRSSKAAIMLKRGGTRKLAAAEWQRARRKGVGPRLRPRRGRLGAVQGEGGKGELVVFRGKDSR
jgi:hypothetical protein